ERLGLVVGQPGHLVLTGLDHFAGRTMTGTAVPPALVAEEHCQKTPGWIERLDRTPHQLGQSPGRSIRAIAAPAPGPRAGSARGGVAWTVWVNLGGGRFIQKPMMRVM